MSATRKHTHVRVGNGVLWIGQQALPLNMITRAATTELRPDRRAVVRHYAVTVALGLTIATAVSAMTPELVSALVSATALAWFTTRTIRLFRAINRPRYQLTVETATGGRQVLVSDNPYTVAAVAFSVVDDPPNRIDMA